MTRRLIVAYMTLTVFALALLATPLGITFARRHGTNTVQRVIERIGRSAAL